MAPTATSTSAVTAGSSGTNSSTDPSLIPGSLEEANQRYLQTKLALRTGLAKKRIIDRSLTDLESQIYLFEGSYLSSTTSSGGNIVKGFDSYLKNSISTRSSNNASEVPLEDRIFSLSSATYQRSLELKAAETVDNSSPEKPKKKKDRDERSATPGKESGNSTPSKGGKTTPGQGLTAKLKRKAETGQTSGGKNKRKKEDE